MTSWIDYPKILRGHIVELVSLEEAHFEELQKAAKISKIWEHYPFDLSDSEKFRKVYADALAKRDSGTQFPFTIFHLSSQNIIGSTRFLDIQPSHKKLEIGFTWIHPDFWGTTVNLECKLLLLSYCFEELEAVRVQLKTDELNIRSRKAIEKIGGKFEGILRHDMLREDGTNRNSAYYSILDHEWRDCKSNLSALLWG